MSTGDLTALESLDDVQRMMAMDMLTYLPNDILTKIDRAAMGVSLETRVPFLDHRVIEFAWRLPQFMKLHRGQTKWILRQVLYRYVPRNLVDRPKWVLVYLLIVGYVVLCQWADDFCESRLKHEGFFYPKIVRKKIVRTSKRSLVAPALEHTNVSKLVGRKQMKKILFVINDAAFFVSHRLPIALRLIKEGYDVHLACRGDNSPIYDEIIDISYS